MSNPNRPTPEELDSISEEMKAGIYCTQEEVEEMLEKGDSVTTHLHNRLYQDLVDVYMVAYRTELLEQLKAGSVVLVHSRVWNDVLIVYQMAIDAGLLEKRFGPITELSEAWARGE